MDISNEDKTTSDNGFRLIGVPISYHNFGFVTNTKYFKTLDKQSRYLPKNVSFLILRGKYHAIMMSIIHSLSIIPLG